MLFDPITISGRRVRCRIARSATNDHLGCADGTVSQAQVREYEALAAGGAGLIFTGHIGVDADHRADPYQNLCCADRFIPGLASLSRAVHGHGAVLYGQISHAGAKGVNPADFNTFTEEDMETVVRQFADGARRLAAAGFDGVQVHLAHGYLLSQTLDDVTNRRRDEYGGSDANRVRLACRIVRAIRAACPASFGVAVKIDSNNSEYTPCPERLIFYVRELERAGICAAEVSGRNFSSFPAAEECYYLPEAAALARQVRIPVLLAGGLYSRENMERALSAGVGMVSLCRSLIAEPDFPERLRTREEEASRCLRCGKCLSVYRTGYRRCVLLGEEPQLRMNFDRI